MGRVIENQRHRRECFRYSLQENDRFLNCGRIPIGQDHLNGPWVKLRRLPGALKGPLCGGKTCSDLKGKGCLFTPSSKPLIQPEELFIAQRVEFPGGPVRINPIHTRGYQVIQLVIDLSEVD